MKKNTVFILFLKLYRKWLVRFGIEKSLNFRLLWEIIGFLLWNEIKLSKIILCSFSIQKVILEASMEHFYMRIFISRLNWYSIGLLGMLCENVWN